MTTEKLLHNTSKTPHQLFFGAFAFLAANICIMVLHIDKFFMISVYASACILCYLSCYWGYSISKIISALLLFVTIMLNFFGKPILGIPGYQVAIVSAGIFFSLVAYYYLFCRALKTWFHMRKNARWKKATQQYSEKDFQNFLEVQKNIPRSYRWGKWFFLVLMLMGLAHFSQFSLESSYLVSRDIVSTFFLVIGCVGLMQTSPRLIQIFVAYSYCCLSVISVALFIGIIAVLKALYDTGTAYPFLIGFLKGISGYTGNNSNATAQATTNSLYVSVPAVMMFYIFLNKKSREWLKAKRVTKKMLATYDN